MHEVVICDTNVVIQIAIIYPSALTQKSKDLTLVVHPQVKTEISSLKQDPVKNTRLGNILDFILKNVPTSSSHHLPNKQKEIQQHRYIQSIECTLPSGLISAGSSHEDRRFLILARFNKAKLMTNERTLFNLGLAILGTGNVWRVSDALECLLTLKLASQPDLQKGLDELAKHGERLGTECTEKIRKLGFKYDP